MDKNQTIEEITKLIVNESVRVGREITTNDFYIVHQPLNHNPLDLPEGKMAVYTFVYKNRFLKVGQTQINQRYKTSHYGFAHVSTLANSLVYDEEMHGLVNHENAKEWIKTNCERFDVILEINLGKITLNFLEGILQYKYQPKYEG